MSAAAAAPSMSSSFGESHSHEWELASIAEKCSAPVNVPIDSLRPGDTPRSGSEDAQHCVVLAGIEGPLPPVLVHRQSMRVIDGMHRLAAAKHRGDKSIEVRFFEGNTEAAYVLAVRANTTHGKPLTLPERRRSAVRILQTYAKWSDRAIAEVCGLSADTVASLRSPTVGNRQLDSRVGRDGRKRPLDTNRARREAAKLMQEQPSASLREVARATGISPETVRDVRDRLRSGKAPEVPRTRVASVDRPADRADPEEDVTIEQLRNDPALSATDETRAFVDWLAARLVEPDDWRQFVRMVPKSRIYAVAELARSCARTWSDFADRLEEQVQRGRRA